MISGVKSLRSKTTRVPVVPPTADHLVALAVDATPAVDEDALDEAAGTDLPNAGHIPMSLTGLPFRKTTSAMSIGPSSLIILRRSLMMTRPTLLEESLPRLTAFLFRIKINSKTTKTASTSSPMLPSSQARRRHLPLQQRTLPKRLHSL